MYFRLGVLWHTHFFAHWNVLLVFPAGLFLIGFDAWDWREKMLDWLQFVVAWFLLLLSHELGHLYFARRAGLQPVAIVVSAFGGGCLVKEDADFTATLLVDLGGVIFQSVILAGALAFMWLADDALVTPVEPALLVFIYVNAAGIIAALYPSVEPSGLRQAGIPTDGRRILNSLKNRKRNRK